MAGTIDSAVERRRDQKDESRVKQGGTIRTSNANQGEDQDPCIAGSGGPGEGDSSATKMGPRSKC
jgi:hypothetical protein